MELSQYYVAAWIGGGLGVEWIHAYVWLSTFTIHLKLSQHCWLAILQYKTKTSKTKKENKLSLKELLKRGTWGETTTRWSHSTLKKFTFSLRKLLDGHKWRLNKPHPGPISQHFGSDQESLTRMQATSPAGCRQPGTGNSNHLHTDITEPSHPVH